jgi:hypothetical protein
MASSMCEMLAPTSRRVASGKAFSCSAIQRASSLKGVWRTKKFHWLNIDKAMAVEFARRADA